MEQILKEEAEYSVLKFQRHYFCVPRNLAEENQHSRQIIKVTKNIRDVFRTL